MRYVDGRPETNKLLEMIDDGLLDPKDVALACVKYMSEDEVADMMDSNEWSDRFQEDDCDDGDPGEMDGDHASALASCGWGTDEDYGCFDDGGY